VPSCFTYTPAKPAKKTDKREPPSSELLGELFVCCCVYFNRYARSVKVTVRVLPGGWPVSPENAGLPFSTSHYREWFMKLITLLLVVFTSGVRNSQQSVVTEVLGPRCARGTSSHLGEHTAPYPPIAQGCHRSSVPATLYTRDKLRLRSAGQKKAPQPKLWIEGSLLGPHAALR